MTKLPIPELMLDVKQTTQQTNALCAAIRETVGISHEGVWDSFSKLPAAFGSLSDEQQDLFISTYLAHLLTR